MWGGVLCGHNVNCVAFWGGVFSVVEDCADR
jgi:hypothetical protein